MEPTAEQLIRDYLNRLSVVARDRLRSDERHAFVARTREFIERQSGAPSMADPARVREVLAGLGEPAAAVESEHARLEARRNRRAARSGMWRPRSRDGEGGGSTPEPPGGTGSAAAPPAVPAPRPAQGPRRAPRVAVDVSQLIGRELTGDREKKLKANRPVTSRWRPGEPVRERPVKPRQSRPLRVPRPRAGGSKPSDQENAAAPAPGTGPAQADAEPEVRGPQPASPRSASPQPASPQDPGASAPPAAGAPPAPAAPGTTPPAPASPASQGGTAGSAPVPGGAVPGGAVPGGAVPGGAAPGGTAPGVTAAGGGPSGSASPADASSAGGAAGSTAPGGGRPEAAGSQPAPAGRVPSPWTMPGTVRSATRGNGPSAARRPVTPLQWRLSPPPLSNVPRALAGRAAGFWRRHRMEAVALVLLALGGLIYPVPIWLVGFLLWLIGAIMVSTSPLWSPSDKWAALVGPVVLVIAGAAAAITFGGKHHRLSQYVHEVQVNSFYMIKICALLGVAYLAWRAHRGRRSPVPPWHRARRPRRT
jgi:hypothetical protein